MTATSPQFLSDHFTLREALSSQKAEELGIDNSHPSAAVLNATQYTAGRMELVRTALHGVSIHVDSWIRCLELNTALGSHPNSQHILGEAVDFIAQGFGTPLDIAKAIIAANDTIQFDQLILEGTWVHISFCAPTVQPRGHVLSLLETGGYAIGITDKKGNKL